MDQNDAPVVTQKDRWKHYSNFCPQCFNGFRLNPAVVGAWIPCQYCDGTGYGDKQPEVLEVLLLR
ncbi:MAG: hypothetical protein KBC81_01310 [Candidatus Pacebacteria bacterium]|nr:hypothetical protein [Candidatus Paceibacterota bacterium]